MLPTDEDLAVPHFEDALLDRLHEQQKTGSYRRRSRPPRLVLVGAVAAATALIAGVALVQGGDDDPTDVGTGNPTEAGQTDPELPDRVLAALDEALPRSIVHTNNPAGRVEVWSDPTSKAERRIAPASNAPDRTIDWGRSVPPGLDDRWADNVPTRWLDHCLKQYSDKVSPALSMGDTAQFVRDGLEVGLYAADGSEVVDGRQLLRLVPLPPPPPVQDPPIDPDDPDAAERQAERDARIAEARLPEASDEVVYIDPATDLPVLWVGRDGGRETIELLPRTAENMALLVPPVPEGYKKVAENALDEVRAGGCV